MNDWSYVALGWIITYGVIGVWYYTSRTSTTDEKSNDSV